jgi:hypothetical protein
MSAWKEAHHGVTPIVALSIDRRLDYETFLRVFTEVVKIAPKVRLAFRTSQNTPQEGAEGW